MMNSGWSRRCVMFSVLLAACAAGALAPGRADAALAEAASAERSGVAGPSPSAYQSTSPRAGLGCGSANSAACAADSSRESSAPSVLAASGGKSTILWGSYRSALVRSTDLGVTWLPIYVTQARLPQPPVLTFDIDSSDPNR